MSRASQFPRIVVIKSFNQDCIQGIQEKLGKYTHIQSLNGVFLDGMNISEVTNVFQTSKATEAQLIVRYIHPLKEGDHPPNTPFPVTPAPLKPQAPRCSLTTEVLPIPVFILGDVATLCSELFRLLSLDAESPHSDVSQGSSSVSSPRHPPSSVSSQPQFTSLTSESSLVSQYPDEGSDVPRPLSAVRKDINGRKMSKHVVKSDERFERASIPFSLLSLDAESPHSDVSQGSSSVSSPRHPPSSVSSQPQFTSLTSESSLVSQYPDEGSDVPRPLSAVRKDINGRKMSKHVVKSDERFERASIPFSLFRNLPHSTSDSFKFHWTSYDFNKTG